MVSAGAVSCARRSPIGPGRRKACRMVSTRARGPQDRAPTRPLRLERTRAGEIAPGPRPCGMVIPASGSAAMRFYNFEIVIEKEPEDEGYSAYSPSLPGCFSNGRTDF